MCGCSHQCDHPFTDDIVDKYDDGSFDQLFAKYRREADDNDGAFTIAQKELVMALLWMSNNGTAKRDPSVKSESISPPSTSSCYGRFTQPLGILPVISKKKRSGSGDQGFVIPKKSPSSHDDTHHHHHLEEKEDEATKNTTVSRRKERGTGILNGFVNKNKYSKRSTTADQEDKKLERKRRQKKMISTNKKRRFDIQEEEEEEEEGKKSTSKRRKSDEKAVELNLGFDFSDEIKALIGEEGDEDFQLRIRKKLYKTDSSAHHDRFTMPLRQIHQCEHILIGEEKRDVRIGDGIGVTLVELGLGDEKDSMFSSQLRMKEWDMSKSSSFALRSGWKDVMLRNVGLLQENDYVQMYSFGRAQQGTMVRPHQGVRSSRRSHRWCLRKEIVFRGIMKMILL